MNKELNTYYTNEKLYPKEERHMTVPIRHEFQAASYAQYNNDYCKKTIAILKVLVLLAFLILLSWASIILCINYHLKCTLLNSSQNDALNIPPEDIINPYYNNYNKNNFQKTSGYGIRSRVARKADSTKEEEFKNWLQSLDTKDLFSNIRENPRFRTDLKRFADNPEDAGDDIEKLFTQVITKYRDIVETYMKNLVINTFDAVDTNFEVLHSTAKSGNNKQKREAVRKNSNEKSEMSADLFSDDSANHKGLDDTSKPFVWENNLKLADAGYYIFKKYFKVREQQTLYSYEAWVCKILENESPERQIKLFEFIKASKSPYYIDEDDEYSAQKPLCQKPQINESTSRILWDEEPNIIDELINSEVYSYSDRLLDLDLYMLIAEELEKCVGNYNELLIWYYQDYKAEDWDTQKYDLKVLTAELLFGWNMERYHYADIKILGILEHFPEFYENYEKLLDGNIKNMTRRHPTATQSLLVDNMIFKSIASDLQSRNMISSKYITQTIKNNNWRKLGQISTDLDRYTLMGGKKENLKEFLMCKIKPCSKVGPLDTFTIMTKRLDALVGNYTELLVWYYENNNKLIKKEDNLKILASEVLFGINPFKFYNNTVKLHKALLSDAEYLKDYKQILNGTMPTLKPETYNQAKMRSWLITKMSHLNMLGTNMNSFDIAQLFHNLIMTELKQSGIDTDRNLN